MLYLQEQLNADRKEELEVRLEDNDFASDALEGLQELKDKKRISQIVDGLNRDLKKKIRKKKERRSHLTLPDHTWLWTSVTILLLLVVLCYFVIVYLRERG